MECLTPSQMSPGAKPQNDSAAKQRKSYVQLCIKLS